MPSQAKISNFDELIEYTVFNEVNALRSRVARVKVRIALQLLNKTGPNKLIVSLKTGNSFLATQVHQALILRSGLGPNRLVLIKSPS